MKKLILLFILISGLSYSDDMPQTENYNVNDVMIGDIVGGGSGLNPIPGYDPAMHKQGVGNVISDKQERAIKKIVEETKKGAIDGAVKGIVEGKGIKNVMIDATKGAVEGSIRGINDVINEKYSSNFNKLDLNKNDININEKRENKKVYGILGGVREVTDGFHYDLEEPEGEN